MSHKQLLWCKILNFYDAQNVDFELMKTQWCVWNISSSDFYFMKVHEKIWFNFRSKHNSLKAFSHSFPLFQNWKANKSGLWKHQKWIVASQTYINVNTRGIIQDLKVWMNGKFIYIFFKKVSCTMKSVRWKNLKWPSATLNHHHQRHHLFSIHYVCYEKCFERKS